SSRDRKGRMTHLQACMRYRAQDQGTAGVPPSETPYENGSHWGHADAPHAFGLLRPAATGHAAAPPSSVMNWRRLGSSMGSPPGTRCASLPQAQDVPEAPEGPWGRPESFWFRV